MTHIMDSGGVEIEADTHTMHSAKGMMNGVNGYFATMVAPQIM